MLSQRLVIEVIVGASLGLASILGLRAITKESAGASETGSADSVSTCGCYCVPFDAYPQDTTITPCDSKQECLSLGAEPFSIALTDERCLDGVEHCEQLNDISPNPSDKPAHCQFERDNEVINGYVAHCSRR